MTLTEVRCCCEPMKLLGYLPSAPSGSIGMSFVTRDGIEVHLNLAKWANHRRYPEQMLDPHIQGFEIRLWRRHEYEGGVAYKADGLDVETLQRIPGFLTAVPEKSNV